MLTERPVPAVLPSAADFLDPALPLPACLAALGRLGFGDPTGALANLRRLAETPDVRDQLAPLLPRLLHHLGASADPDMALNNLERLAQTALDRRGFYTLLAAHPEAIPVLTTLLATSQFLADALIRSPQIVPWLLDPRVMQARSREAMHAEVAGACRPFRTEEARLHALRRVKRRELCRIGLRDLLGDADLVTTTLELSELADACLAQAWAMVEPALLERYGRPAHPAADGRRLPTGFAMIALGKHGGSELNYSSDIDLCFVYEAEGETEGPEVVSSRTYFARLAEQLVGALTTMTEEGTVYRVDLRLRPEGAGGPLALPLDAYRAYHATRGALWERQALIKARVAAGDERVGQAFLDLVREIVYRPGQEREALGEIRAMKNRIDRRLRARGQQERHVKLGVGGIRDIEFHIQALQLLYGGQDPWLRERNSLRALHRLAERGYLSWEESGGLAHAYVFLRTIEHRLQILHALQTHTLPADPDELAKLARRLGYAGDRETAARTFLVDYDRTRRTVRAAFEGFFDAPAREAPEAPPWTPAAVAAVRFADPERARQNLRLLWEGPALVAVPAAVRTALRTLLPATLEALGTVPDPDAALDALERFVATAGPRTAYLARLASTPPLLGGVLTLFTRSERLAQTLIARPELLDALGSAAGTAPRSARRLRAAFRDFAAPGADTADRLRLFKQREELLIAWRDLVLGEPPTRVAWALGELAEACLGIAWEHALAEARTALGEPLIAGRPVPALVVGMGKLGGRELDYGSDLDLVVLYGGPSEAGPEAHVYFDRVVDHLYTLLTAITRTGQVFRVDLRLRQGGKATALAHALGALDRYLGEEAALWERQALVRARPILGDPALARRFVALRRVRVFGPGLSDAERAEIHRVRTRMELELAREGPGRIHLKFGAGGLVDVEFLVQVLQLTHGARHGTLRTPSTRLALARLGALAVLPAARAEKLLEAYEFLRRLLRSLRLAQARPADCLPTTGHVLARLAREAGQDSGRALLARHREVAEGVRAEYFRVVGDTETAGGEA
ncbi:MAG TPA: bifunctional [glutamate--ammonia ligase]-adenylyl-L-tyrosine phosphorylase/[glutamate--ammonia-ligase] adenylyltransferase [Methylomirabilota bacterium]|nr:bifunctional [glutamate--ammonia ligase]-adenylyl-L-tyrosine phosphorylase/[glutamate--ammonia-ligase] adenylyltransferase [Methylomirabilota bacterium]